MNLKLFAAMRQLDRPLDSHRPLLLDLVRAYAVLFPEEISPLYRVFLETTWGATVSREASAALEALAHQGQSGNITPFRDGLHAAVAMLKELHADLVAGRRALDGNVGPELWVLNPSFLVPKSTVHTDVRTLPLTINLNTASVPELMTIEGIDLNLARSIVEKRRELGFFRGMDDLGVTAPLLNSLRTMQQLMGQAALYYRA